jgi:peroxiredoxin Q/BCP
MSDSAGAADLDFELPNVAAGPDPYRLSARAGAVDWVVLLFQRDYHCGNCRDQVRAVKARYDEFEARDAEAVSILPEPRERTRRWQEGYDLPYPLLADSGGDVGEQYDQPRRFGALGRLHDMIGRMPETAVVDLRGDRPRLAWNHRGDAPADRPDVDGMLARLDRLRE